MGISALIPCKSTFDFWCMLAKSTAQKGVYTQWAQDNLIQVSQAPSNVILLPDLPLQAAYFRDPDRLDEFHRMNVYLTGLNGELEALPHPRLASLSHFVMVQFDEDRTVYPKESSQFGYLVSPNSTLLELQESPFLWDRDSIGLRKLHKHDGLVFEHCPGAHMDLEWGKPDGCAERILGDWIAGKM